VNSQSDNISKAGWLNEARECASPNYNERPENVDIDLIVVHSISLPPGQYGDHYIDDFFCNRLDCSVHPYFKEIEGLQVSAHLLIDRQGQLTQYVSFFERAWHAGESCFEGRERCNDFSIGIEMEGLEGAKFEREQYQRLAEVCKELMKRFPKITEKRICGHSDIAPGRKIDPGPGFDWTYFRGLFKELSSD
jgi:AmpD protein